MFSSVVFADEGQYKCQAAYSGLTGNLQSTEFELFVRGENWIVFLCHVMIQDRSIVNDVMPLLQFQVPVGVCGYFFNLKEIQLSILIVHDQFGI